MFHTVTTIRYVPIRTTLVKSIARGSLLFPQIDGKVRAFILSHQIR